MDLLASHPGITTRPDGNHPASSNPDAALPPEYRHTAQWCGVGAAAIGLVGLLGWASGIRVLECFIPGARPVAPVATLFFVLLGLMLAREATRPAGRAMRCAASAVLALVAVLGAYEMAETLIGLPHGLEIAVLRHAPVMVRGESLISPAAAGLASLTSVALLLLHHAHAGDRRRVAASWVGGLSTVVTLIAATYALSYVYCSPLLAGLDRIHMSCPAAFALMTLGVGLCAAAGPSVAPICWFTGSSTRALLLRSLLPATMVALLLGDLLQSFLKEHLQFNTAALSAFTSIACAVIITGIISRVARRIGRHIDHADALLFAEKERLLVTLRSIGDAVIATDEMGTVKLLNGVAETLTGWTQADAVGHPINEVFVIVNEETREPCVDPIAEVLTTGMVVGLANHTLLIGRDGTERAIADSGAPIRDRDGRTIGVVLVFRDVTEERQAVKALQESERLYRSLVTVLPEGVALSDTAGNVTYTSPQMLAIYGAEPDDATRGTNAFDWIAPESREKAVTNIQALVRGEPSPDNQYVLQKRDGTRFVGEITGALLTDEDGRPTGMVTVHRDVTDRRQMEEALRASEARSRKIFQDGPLGMATANAEFRFLNANAAFCAMLGYSEEELCTRTFRDITHPEHLATDTRCIEDLRRGEIPAYQTEKRYLRKDGVVLWGALTVSVVRDAEGTFLYFLSMVEDITERKRAETALCESERTLTSLYETVPVGICLTDEAGRFILVNDAYCRMFGYTEAELLGQHRSITVPAEEIGMAEVNYQRVLDGDTAIPSVRRRIRRDGTEFYIEARNALLVAEDGSRQIIGVAHDITERIQAEGALAKSHDFYLTLFEKFPTMIWRSRPDAQCDYFNETWLAFTGRSLEQEQGDGWLVSVHPDDVEHYLTVYLSAFEKREPFEMEYRLRRADGEYRKVQNSGRPFTGLSGEFAGYLGVCADITDHLRMEEQLRQAVKMESIGRLAGGIAHDFNNLLTGISGLTQLAQADVPAESRTYTDLAEVLTLSDRAANLTRQLLAFSRHQAIEPHVLDLNALVDSTLKMLQRLIGEDIDLRFQPAESLWPVNVDPGRIEQVLVNLAVNARDSMPGGGALTIETANTHIDQHYADRNLGARPGAYVRLTIMDTGTGMDRATQEHIFEPFFTTKEVGQGTGLGLATVYGIVKQHGGNIWVYSEPGEGTAFKIYLPRADMPIEPIMPETTADTVLGGQEVVLLVEDEQAVREVVERILTSHGYTVISAATPAAAEALFAQHADRIALLLTDVVMPGCNGPELHQRLTAVCPELRVVFMSGYSEAKFLTDAPCQDQAQYIQKPFTAEDILRTMRVAIEANREEVTHGGGTHPR